MDKLLADLKDFLKPEVVWCLLAIVLLLLELAMPGLIIFFFALGAFVVAFICLLTNISLSIQLLIFIAASIIFLLALRRYIKGVFMGHIDSKQNITESLSEFIGEKAVVTTNIIPKAGGRVEFHGTSWQAEADEEISEGTIVQITGKDNITLKVEPL